VIKQARVARHPLFRRAPLRMFEAGRLRALARGVRARSEPRPPNVLVVRMLGRHATSNATYPVGPTAPLENAEAGAGAMLVACRLPVYPRLRRTMQPLTRSRNKPCGKGF
jgi:hypothetical protein